MASERLQVILQMVAGQYKSEAKQAASATGQIGKSAQFAGTQTKGMGQRMKGLATGGGGLVAMAGGAFAAKKAFDGTVGAFASFDDAMTESLAIMGDVSSAMRDEMSDAAREVGKTTTFSAEEAAEAYFFLASAGLDAAQSIEAMPAVAQFAQAGMFDLAQATDLATDAQSALGLAADDPAKNLDNLTRVTDVFVKANTLANASVEQFATAMTQKAGGALRSVGKDIEEGTAVLAVFADQGIKGERAGTILRATLDGLSTKARDNADAFAEFGVRVFDAEGNMRNMADITSDIEGALAGMTTEQREAALAQLGFNKRSREGILALLGNSEALRENEQALRDAGGAAEEVADKQLESAKKQWELFLAGLQDVGIELGEKVTPALLDMLPALQEGAESIGGMVEALGPLIEGLGMVAQGYNDLKGGAEGLAEDAAESGDAVLGVAGRLSEFATRPAAAVFFDLIGDAIGGAGDAADDAAPGFSTLGGEMNQIPSAAHGAADATGDFADDADDAGDSAEDAADSVRDLTLAFLEAANPIFAAQGALDRYEQAQADLEETRADSESTAKDIAAAELDVANAALEAEAALVELGDGSITEGISAIAAALNISDEEARDLLETLGILDGQEVTSVVNTEFRTIGRPPSSSKADHGNISFRQHGGPVGAGQPFIVGERGPEMFIPQQDGLVTSRTDTDRLIEAFGGSSRSLNVTYVNPRLADDPVESIRNAFALDSLASV